MPAWWEQFLHMTTGRISRHDKLFDLRHLPTRPVVLERTHFLVNDRERGSQSPRAYVLRTQARTRRDPAGVEVTSNGRGVGYLPDDMAGAMIPLLNQLGGAAVVNGTGSKAGSLRLWVDLPVPDAVDDFIQTFVDATERPEVSTSSLS